MNNNQTRSRVNAIDSYIGNKLRMRRMMCGMSQEIIGDALGVSIQQVQKYEKGMNRISATNLYRLTKFFKIPFSYFFEGIENEKLSQNTGSMTAGDIYSPITIDNEKEIFTFITSYNRIAKPKIRKKIVDLVTTLSELSA